MRELDDPESIFNQEKTIYQVIHSRLEKSELLKPEQKETIAYRLAELFVASRILYTQVLPAFLESPGESDAATPKSAPVDADEIILETLGEVRMNLLNLKDLVEDFEDVFLESLADRQVDGADEEEPEEPSSPLGRG